MYVRPTCCRRRGRGSGPQTRSLALFLGVLLAVQPLLLHSADAAPPARRRRAARRHFKAGQRAYKAKEYATAAERFRKGYELDPRPGFLLNIAQSYRMAENYEQAIKFYELYLTQKPKSPLRAQVENLIGELKEKRDAQEATSEPKPTGEPKPKAGTEATGESEQTAKVASEVDSSPAAAQPTVTARRSEPTQFYQTWWFWTLVVVVVGGAVGAGVGIALATAPDYVEDGSLGSVRW